MIFPHLISFIAPNPLHQTDDTQPQSIQVDDVPALVMSSNPVNTNVETFQGLGTTLSGEFFDIYLTRKAYNDMIAAVKAKNGNNQVARSAVTIRNSPGRFNPFYETTNVQNVDGKIQGVAQFPGMLVLSLQIISLDF